MRYFKRVIAYFSCLLTEDSAEESFLSSELCLTLRSYLTNENIARVNFRADAYDTVFIKVCKSIVADIRDVACDLFRSEFGIAAFDLVFFYMN